MVRMKKIYFVMVIFSLLVSCAPVVQEQAEVSIPDVEVSAEEKIAVAPKLFKIGDEIVAGEFKWKVTKITKQKEIGQDIAGTFFGAKADGEFLVLDVEIENIGKSANILSDSFIKLVDDQGREFTADTAASIYLEQGAALSFYDTVNPGIVKKGKVIFDVPVGLDVVNVRISDSLLTDSFYTVKLVS